MNSKSLKNYILVIIDSINSIEEYISDMDYQNFKYDQKTIDATLMQFQHIGETFKKIKKDFPNFNDYPHEQIVGFRDIISHDYLGTDTEEVWLTIKKDIPTLKKALHKSLENIE